MASQLQQHTGSTNWLAMLVATFETISRDGGKPGAMEIAGLETQLSHSSASLVVKSSSLH